MGFNVKEFVQVEVPVDMSDEDILSILSGEKNIQSYSWIPSKLTDGGATNSYVPKYYLEFDRDIEGKYIFNPSNSKNVSFLVASYSNTYNVVFSANKILGIRINNRLIPFVDSFNKTKDYSGLGVYDFVSAFAIFLTIDKGDKYDVSIHKHNYIHETVTLYYV